MAAGRECDDSCLVAIVLIQKAAANKMLPVTSECKVETQKDKFKKRRRRQNGIHQQHDHGLRKPTFDRFAHDPHVCEFRSPFDANEIFAALGTAS